jgi:hypothetical protein
MARPNTPDHVKARAVAAVRAGLSLRAAAAQVGATAPTVARWVKEADAEPTAPSAPVAPPAAPVAPAALPVDSLERVRGMLAQFVQMASDARGVGNYDSAVTAMRQAAQLEPLIARLEKLRGEDSSVMKVSRADIAAAVDSARAKIAALNSRPLLCAECSCELSARLGNLAEDATQRMRDHREKARKSRKV